MKKVIFIGKTGSGKTTLCQKLNELSFHYKKTQAVERYENSIDTPGEYLENRHFYNALIMTAVDARVIAFLADPTSAYQALPPSFAGTFAKKVIGIITKVSLADGKQIEKARKQLTQAGVSRIFEVDTLKNEGIEELMKYLEKEGA